MGAYTPQDAIPPQPREPSHRQAPEVLPLLLKIILVLTFLPWVFGNYQIAGYQVTGWSWMAALFAALPFAIMLSRVSFPLRYWFPWLTLLIMYYVFRGRFPNAAQTTAQTITPFVVACAVSAFRLKDVHAHKLLETLKMMAPISWVLLVFTVPMLRSGALPTAGTNTPEAISACLLASTYATLLNIGDASCLYRYVISALLPVVLLTRGPILAVLAVLPCSFGPVRPFRRLAYLAIIAGAGIVLFYTPRVQTVMFKSGKGTISDLSYENQDLELSGRRRMWETLWEDWRQKPFVGYGVNSSRTLLVVKLKQTVYLPHNDWLRLLHDYGGIGAGFFAMGILLTLRSLLRLARQLPPASQRLAYAAATAFIPYVFLMFTDNITLYVQYFGNLHFALIGVVFAIADRHGLLRRGGRRMPPAPVSSS